MLTMCADVIRSVMRKARTTFTAVIIREGG
jgi:hypothetical protein